jgi:hypothetical protein
MQFSEVILTYNLVKNNYKYPYLLYLSHYSEY